MSLSELLGLGMAAQFKPSGHGYIYRENAKGPPIPVSREERDRFVRRYAVHFVVQVAGFMGAVILAAVLTDAVFPTRAAPGGFVLMGALMLAIGFLLFRWVRWALAAPSRALAGRGSAPTL
ncbi:hypothetical protein [Roseomonas populi]|uniref:DUF423 domain-containing protein n=1 Tax=Roseomonas populi TaxID=3121582 RepID=A0ABT1X9B3_9PROT|nr:hypothetical protein [Roseomonas pecuniae]MCR0983554.1 hypothetical protein [Roseomonas pecuniae]